MYAIEVEALSKSYVINHQAGSAPASLRELLTAPFKNKSRALITEELPQQSGTEKEEFWALKDVNFQVQEGERVAVIGGNGAGKSTLLKILSRITEPTNGKVQIKGKVASLLEVGTGFHPELTGRENIFLNGAILGMRRKEIVSKFDQIVDFSGVEKFIDTPVKHYSSGMYVRLAFSVSAWLDPDILIVDEVLSVGDQAFQKRCADRMKELTGEGRTVIFVSHSMAAVKAMCKKALYLKNGQVMSYANVDDVATDYVRSVLEETDQAAWHSPEFSYVEGATENHSDTKEYAECVYACIENDDGDVASLMPLHKSFKVKVRYRIRTDVSFKFVPNFHFYTEDGGRLFISFPESVSHLNKGEYVATCEIPPFQLNVGRFSVMPVLSSYELPAPVHFAIPNLLRFEITEEVDTDPRRHGWKGSLPGVSRPRLDWNIEKVVA